MITVLNKVLLVLGQRTCLVLIVYSWGPPSFFSPPYWYNFTRSNPAYFDRKHKSRLYFLHSFNQLNQIILIPVLLFWTKVQNLILLLGRDINLRSFGPKLVCLQSSVGIIKLLFIIPTVNRTILIKQHY